MEGDPRQEGALPPNGELPREIIPGTLHEALEAYTFKHFAAFSPSTTPPKILSLPRKGAGAIGPSPGGEKVPAGRMRGGGRRRVSPIRQT